MAEQIVSPGVFARENDQSFITQQAPAIGAALIGPTVLGPVEVPTLVTSYSDYLNRFGSTFVSSSTQYTYFTSIAAFNYFNNGGESLLVTRVVTGSFSSSVSTPIQNSVEAGTGGLIVGTNLGVGVAAAAVAATYINVPLTGSLTGTGALATVVVSAPTVIDSVTITTAGSGFAVGEAITISETFIGGVAATATVTDVLTATDIVNQVAFTIKSLTEGVVANSSGSEDASGSLSNGTANNLRWEISQTSSGSGTFTLLVRRGNDNNNAKVVLETWANLSLDPLAPNYITKVIGDMDKNLTIDGSQQTFLSVTGSYPNASRFIRVDSVTAKTPNYFDNTGLPKSEYTASLPLVGSGSMINATGNLFEGAANYYENINNTNTQGLAAKDYTSSIALLANADEYQYNAIIVPGLVRNSGNFSTHVSVVNALVNNTAVRGDNLAVIDVAGYNSEISSVTSQVAGIDTSYAATYWPWLQTIDPDSGELVWVPASTLIPSVYAFNDSVSEPWFAPAGLNRGALPTVVRPERKLSQGNRDTLYSANVNPIASFPNSGNVVYGQKTLQKRASALDRVNVRRLLIALKDYISGVSENLVFEQNTIATRNQFLSIVNPYLESVQQRQGLYAFKVVMDESNNTPDVIDRNQLVGQIFLQPTKTAEFIILDFNVLPTGATFS
jgi:uncharacterized protein